MSIVNEITRLQNAKAALKTALEAKGVTVSSDATLDSYATLIDNIPSGGSSEVEEKDVNFYDYDGTCVYSYTKQEFLALTEMPTLPDHTDIGLTAQGWNWSLSGAKTFMNKMPFVDIGAIYNCDGIYIYVNIEDITLPFSLCLYKYQCENDTFTVFWGDGESNEITANNETEAKNNLLLHSYASTGEYKIVLKCTQNVTNKPSIHSSASYSNNLYFGITGGLNYSYNNDRITKVFIGIDSNTGTLLLDGYEFANCRNLQTIILNSAALHSTSVNHVFSNCRIQYATFANFDMQYASKIFAPTLISTKIKGIVFSNVSNVKIVFGDTETEVKFISFGESPITLLDKFMSNNTYTVVDRISGFIKSGYNYPFGNAEIRNIALNIAKYGSSQYAWSFKTKNLYIDADNDVMSNVRFDVCYSYMTNFPSKSVIIIPSLINDVNVIDFNDYVTTITLGNYGVEYNFPFLKSIYVRNTNVPTLTIGSGVHFRSDLIFYVPASAVEDYKAANGWSTYADKIQAIPE